jgi:hypothetical protein
MNPAPWRYFAAAAAIGVVAAVSALTEHGSARQIVVWSLFGLVWLAALALRNRFRRHRTPPRP